MDIELKRLQTELSIAYTKFCRVVEQLEPSKQLQSGVSGDWSPKDVLAHLIGWDQALYQFIIDPEGFNPDPLYDIDKFNAKSVSERHHQSWDEVLSALKGNYLALESKITTVTADMQIYDRVVGWVQGRTKDYEFHRKQLEDAIEDWS